jgi:hypothetical protein
MGMLPYPPPCKSPQEHVVTGSISADIWQPPSAVVTAQLVKVQAVASASLLACSRIQARASAKVCSPPVQRRGCLPQVEMSQNSVCIAGCGRG